MKYKNPEVESSFRENDLGKTLYDLVFQLKPKKIVEFGTLNGYSTLAMAMALDTLTEKSKKPAGKIISYDLWDSYQFKHGVQSVVQDLLESKKLDKYVTLQRGDFTHWTPEGDEDMVFVDVSNDGKIVKMLADKMKNSKAFVIFEGGTLERDRVQWMTRFNKPPIRSSGVRYEIIDDRFPGISKLL